MSRDPFDQMKSRNPVPEGQAPAAPMGVANRIVGGRTARRAGWPGWAVAAATAAVVLGVGGGMYWLLGGGGSEVAASTSTTGAGVTTTTVVVTTTNGSTEPVIVDGVVYFFLDQIGEGWTSGPYLVPVHATFEVDPGRSASERTLDEAGMAMARLVEGVGDDATSVPAMSSAIPIGTQFQGVAIEEQTGIITVYLSSDFVSGGGSLSMAGRIGQVVFTLTAIDGVHGVRFSVGDQPTTVFGGEGFTIDDPATRAGFEDLLPAVMIESPAWNGAAGNPAVVTGTANVFEAVVSLALVDDDGLIRWEGTTMATCGTGCRGDWTVTIPYTVDEAQWGSIIAWEASAMDGSQTNVREHRIWLTPSTGPTVEGAVYFFGEGDRDTAQSGPYLIPVARHIDPNAPYATALQALLDGPTGAEAGADLGISTAIPQGTIFNGVTVDGRIATVDLSTEFTSGGGSFSMMGRLAQVIYTMTRLPEVDGVRFLVDGTLTTVFGGEGVIVDDPVARPEDDTMLPAVMIESPAYGATVGNPLEATGTANVFEATVSVSLYAADGTLLFDGFTTATCGSGCRGEWSLTIPYDVATPQWGRLVAFESSAMDGSAVNVRTHRVWLTPTGSESGPPCSGALVTDPLVDQPDLPAAVAATRRAIWEAAVACDWEGLRSLLGSGFTYSFGGGSDAIAYWQQLEAAGDDPSYLLAELLNRPAGTVVAGDQTYRVWPSAFVGEWQDVPEADREALRPLYDDADFTGFAQFGAYIGYRVSILADGTWVSFVAGD